jgi:tRNA (mo5U34)-methyltransferase
MRLTPPPDFNLTTFYSGVYLFQSWEVFPGLKTEGPKEVSATLKNLAFPADLTGKRVLEVAPWNGFFSFECVRRGAAEIVALGPDDPDQTGFNDTMRLLEIQNVRYIRDSVYNLPVLSLGNFDIVLFLGLIYHLRHPLLALDYLYDCCSDLIFIDGGLIDNGRHFVVPAEQKQLFIDSWTIVNHLPLVYFSHQDEISGGRDRYNWSFPTFRALKDWIATAGFISEHEDNRGDWFFLRARKGTREFNPFLEGYNARMSIRR